MRGDVGVAEVHVAIGREPRPDLVELVLAPDERHVEVVPGCAAPGSVVSGLPVEGGCLAKATGQSTDLAPELAAALLEANTAAIPDEFRGPEGAPFGPKQEAPQGATAADQLAAFLGRTV